MLVGQNSASNWASTFFLLVGLCTVSAHSQTGNRSSQPEHRRLVTITPFGSKTGEFCAADRALLLEDPSGVRILYDPGNTVAGSEDSRLGIVHVVLLSHVHSDHLGNARLAVDPSGANATCDNKFATVPTLPNSNFAQIVVGKNAAALVTYEIAPWISKKVQALRGGSPSSPCPVSGSDNVLVVPLTAPCVGFIGFGAKRTVTMAAGSPGVVISIVSAVHGNSLDDSFVPAPLGAEFASSGLALSLGPACGYVITFTNGLVVYLSGDTGQTADMRAVIHDEYKARLAVLNMGDLYTMGPQEAAFASRNLLQLTSVIPSHANEIATRGGEVIEGTKTSRFIKALGGVSAVVPLSGHSFGFDAFGSCVKGCARDSQ